MTSHSFVHDTFKLLIWNKTLCLVEGSWLWVLPVAVFPSHCYCQITRFHLLPRPDNSDLSHWHLVTAPPHLRHRSTTYFPHCLKPESGFLRVPVQLNPQYETIAELCKNLRWSAQNLWKIASTQTKAEQYQKLYEDFIAHKEGLSHWLDLASPGQGKLYIWFLCIVFYI